MRGAGQCRQCRFSLVSRRERAISSPVAEAAERAVLLARIAEAVKAYPSYATPRAVSWTLEPWTIAAGLLTPTLKNKRPALEHRFAAEIGQIYAKKPAAARAT